ncbi:hypothetical protein NJC38_21930 [Pseudomonas sp. 21LCFQ010]|uniref:hypothetical protein n=1 Tax=Pseudomonas sp. 21LCFQ010 TaxID=2957506 RepID=UPI002097F524|nr:hypothetical protein [Pseudomonas sp. 21LCFQ010]MCO8164801.1 hypothetical protein [Pseudomonas sp. 21LCFQ010]
MDRSSVDLGRVARALAERYRADLLLAVESGLDLSVVAHRQEVAKAEASANLDPDQAVRLAELYIMELERSATDLGQSNPQTHFQALSASPRREAIREFVRSSGSELSKRAIAGEDLSRLTREHQEQLAEHLATLASDEVEDFNRVHLEELKIFDAECEAFAAEQEALAAAAQSQRELTAAQVAESYSGLLIVGAITAVILLFACLWYA